MPERFPEGSLATEQQDVLYFSLSLLQILSKKSSLNPFNKVWAKGMLSVQDFSFFLWRVR